MGLSIGSSSNRRSANLALSNVFKSKGRSGNFKLSPYLITSFTWSGNN